MAAIRLNAQAALARKVNKWQIPPQLFMQML